MGKSKHFRMIVAGLVALSSLALVIGCSQSPLEPGNTATEPQVLTRAAGPESLTAAPVNLYAEQVISAAEGGRLELLDVVLEVPAGAVPQDTLFSIFIPDDEKFFNEFGTDGLVFSQPVKVTMSYRGADLSNVDESTIRIGYYNERLGVWEDLVCDVDQDSKRVTAHVWHFSAYGLISD